MHTVHDQLSALAPAIAFLLTAVPLAALLGRLGFFDATAALLGRAGWIPVGALWLLAASTTVVLNLDTTVVLLTPLYLRLAHNAEVDPMPIVAIPLILASLASSVLPVSNLTTLVAVEQLHLSVGDVVAHLALPSVVASGVGWLVYRRLHPTRLSAVGTPAPDRRALVVGGAVVAGLLVGFTVGPSIGVPSWAVALIADVVLVGVTRWLPWRTVPLLIAVSVTGVAALVALLVPTTLLEHLLAHDQPLAVVGLTGLGAVAANAVNNLPALFVGLGRSRQVTWGLWAWLLGVNTGAVLLPLGALANLLWRRILRAERRMVSWRDHARLAVPVALPALVAAALVLAVERVLAG